MNSPQPNLPLDLRPDHPALVQPSAAMRRQQTVLSAGIVGVGLGLAVGALDIPSEAGYGGVGANFLPWLVALALLACGAVLLWQARRGGYRDLEHAAGPARADWPAALWVSAGLLLNAALIERIGFILSCALTYLLAVQGLRRAGGVRHDTWLVDLLAGALIAAPVYWLFTKLLAINLPGLTASGWL